MTDGPNKVYTGYSLLKGNLTQSSSRPSGTAKEIFTFP